MKKRCLLSLLLFAIVLFHLSCGKPQPEVEQPHPPTRGDPEKLARVLASREQENPPPLTVLEAYQIAQERATEWNEESHLTYMSDLGGLRYISFYFAVYNPYGGSSCERKRSDYETLMMEIDRTSGEVLSCSSGFGIGTYGRLDPNDWPIDSPQALEIADAAGGAAFKEKHPGWSASIWANGIGECWEVCIGVPGDLRTRPAIFFKIDPYTGETRVEEENLNK